MKNTKEPVKIKIIGIILTLLVIIISVLLINNNSTISLWKVLGLDKEKEEIQGISYQIYNYTNGTGKMIVTFSDNESNIVSINLNNENQINCDKNKISADYDINYNETYIFTMKNKNGREKTNTVTVNEDFLQNNGIKMTNIKPDSYNYKVIELDYSLLKNVNYKKQYKVEDGDWIECEDTFVIFDCDVKDVADENDEIRVYVRAINKNNTSEVVEVSKKYKVDTSATTATIQAESLIAAVQDDMFFAGTYQIEVNRETYGVHAYEIKGDQVWSINMTFGTANDVGTSSSYAQNMVIVKVEGDLTINSGVTVAPYYTSYGGPKGFLLYVTGKLINNGTIDNSHGAYAVGQNVYMWKNADGSYEYVPAVGGLGATGNGGAGTTGDGRKTGGGGAGYSGYDGFTRGGNGTSYSGGTGGGAKYSSAKPSEASDYGGAGSSPGSYYNSGGGSGNPGGAATGGNSGSGKNGTGGLIIIYSNEYENNGIISSNGVNTNGGICPGGSSGGGSINIFTNQSTNITQLGVVTNVRYNEILGNNSIAGGAKTGNGGAGGKGTINIGEVRNGQYYDLKDIIEQDKEEYKNSMIIQGDSILSILNDDSLTTGYYYFKANGEEYAVHLYVFDKDTTFTSNRTFGDANDISRDIAATSTEAAYRSYAQNMVVVKVKGDLTINSGVTVAPYYTSYGGPKGFLIYVTGVLTNNGTIDNSHGAYALGQNVYLWKNADGSYEYVPAAGGLGATGNGGAGTAGSERKTGGGGAGYSGYNGFTRGGNGTSYSGGTGGGAKYSSSTPSAASDYGGAGSSPGSYYNSGGGSGNPGGSATGSNSGSGKNGTGGLLIIYANEYKNSGTISANGVNTNGGICPGGSSGGGSINIFYNNKTSNGTVKADGGAKTGNGGKGGNGAITIGNISTGSFIKD